MGERIFNESLTNLSAARLELSAHALYIYILKRQEQQIYKYIYYKYYCNEIELYN